MKKLLFVIVAFCFLCMPVKTKAFDKKDDILFFVQSHQYTADATCVVFGKYCVVGVRTKGILLKSDSQKYFEDIKQGILNIDDNLQKIYVTNDLQEVLTIKQVDKKFKEGCDPLQIYDYVKQKYPKAIDKILLSDNI